VGQRENSLAFLGQKMMPWGSIMRETVGRGDSPSGVEPWNWGQKATKMMTRRMMAPLSFAAGIELPPVQSDRVWDYFIASLISNERPKTVEITLFFEYFGR